MSKFIISGGQKLSGEISVKGAKNAALKIIPAAILSEETITIHNLPAIEDIGKSFDLLLDLGASVEYQDGTATISTKNLNKIELLPKLADKFRTSVMFVGPMLARFGEVKFPHPGGCVIGAGKRPIDLFLEGFRAFGATILEDGHYYHVQAKKLKPINYFFSTVSVTVTESLMMTACLVEGRSVLHNAAMEPEIKALADYLNSQGAKISGAGTPTIIIEGVKKISAGVYNIIPDRIEAGTFLVAGAITRGDLIVSNCNPAHLGAVITKLREAGARVDVLGPDAVRVRGDMRLRAAGISTEEYPGFPTDMQAQYMALVTQAEGVSLVRENIFENRFMHVQELVRMGANIKVDGSVATVRGPAPLSAAAVMCSDLRASASLVLAALIADGESILDRVYHMDRGYERIEEKLRSVGAQISRMGNVFPPKEDE